MGLVLFRKNSVHCNLLCGNEVQWNLDIKTKADKEEEG